MSLERESEIRGYWEGIGLSRRVANALYCHDVCSVDGLRREGRYQISRVPNIGKKGLREIDEIIGWTPVKSKRSALEVIRWAIDESNEAHIVRGLCKALRELESEEGLGDEKFTGLL